MPAWWIRHVASGRKPPVHLVPIRCGPMFLTCMGVIMHLRLGREQSIRLQSDCGGLATALPPTYPFVGRSRSMRIRSPLRRTSRIGRLHEHLPSPLPDAIVGNILTRALSNFSSDHVKRSSLLEMPRPSSPPSRGASSWGACMLASSSAFMFTASWSGSDIAPARGGRGKGRTDSVQV